jgi:nitric oxide dioxygenase
VQSIHRDIDYYRCGPIPFMNALRSALNRTGRRARDIQHEVLGPDLWQAGLD